MTLAGGQDDGGPAYQQTLGLIVATPRRGDEDPVGMGDYLETR